jgi:hypothetical protein
MSVNQGETAQDFAVRIVGTGDDNTFPYGDITAELTNGEKTSLKNICNRIIRKLETENP